MVRQKSLFITCRPGRPRWGQTMLELVAATIIISTALVPALRLTRDGVSQLDRLEQAERCHLLCVSKLEETLAQTAGNWNMGTASGHFGSAGWSTHRFSVTRTDTQASGGIPNALCVVRVVVWSDNNGNGGLDNDEVHCELTSKLARLRSYDYEANLH